MGVPGDGDFFDDRTEKGALGEAIEAVAFLEGVLNASQDCIKVLNADRSIVYMNDGGKRVMEVDDFEAIRGCPWLSFWEGQGRSDAEAALAEAQKHGVGRFTGEANTAKGTPKYWDVTISPIPGRDGKPDHFLSISKDITAEHKAQIRQEMLARESAHRVKNILTVVQAIAAQTFRDLPGDQLGAFEERLTVLAKSQELLLQSEWHSLPIEDVVRASLEPVCGEAGRCEVKGDHADLTPLQGLALSMALHELATNAMKYGALSNGEGSIHVAWTFTDAMLDFAWAERGGPPVTAPTRTGFGTRVLTRNLESHFDGKATLAYEPEGLSFRLQARLA